MSVRHWNTAVQTNCLCKEATYQDSWTLKKIKWCAIMCVLPFMNVRIKSPSGNKPSDYFSISIPVSFVKIRRVWVTLKQWEYYVTWEWPAASDCRFDIHLLNKGYKVSSLHGQVDGTVCMRAVHLRQRNKVNPVLTPEQTYLTKTEEEREKEYTAVKSTGQIIKRWVWSRAEWWILLKSKSDFSVNMILNWSPVTLHSKYDNLWAIFLYK